MAGSALDLLQPLLARLPARATVLRGALHGVVLLILLRPRCCVSIPRWLSCLLSVSKDWIDVRWSVHSTDLDEARNLPPAQNRVNSGMAHQNLSTVSVFLVGESCNVFVFSFLIVKENHNATYGG
ncbi:hypothetical protein OJAV_G00170300 [Oryzias javanicus]|uniref:Uncharacterized protein n=1 Tax=Oryzias javanicus TaxID=123683 RepID=A0A3S2MKU6_ORYJA|nr:hypothetical protein OJAV_G00170300 [Oryzias javanicus]